MQSLYTPAGQTDFLTRLEKLSPDAQPIWGKMSVGQMLAHCQEPLKIAFREKKGGLTLIGWLFGSSAKRKFVSGDAPFDRNLPTDKNFKQTSPKDFEVEKGKLIASVSRFSTLGKAAITTEKHPFFGSMSPEDWDNLTVKHLDHHFRQFGV